MPTDTALSNPFVSRSMRQLLQVCAVVATVAGAAGSAHANSAYGDSVENGYKCEKELAAFDAAPNNWKWLDDALKSGNVLSADCKAVFDKRFESCMKDPEMQWKLKDPERTKGNPHKPCDQEVWAGIADQVENDRQQKKQAEEDAKAKAAEAEKRAAEIAAREVPKATRHDAKLEKAVADAYHREDPAGKMLKVILGDWAEDYEKDAFGNVTGRDLDATVVDKQADGKCYLHNEFWMQNGNGRSFGGKLEARGAGSESNLEILCSKVEGAAAAPAAKSAKAAPKKK